MLFGNGDGGGGPTPDMLDKVGLGILGTDCPLTDPGSSSA